jgi:hypothetical protein
MDRRSVAAGARDSDPYWSQPTPDVDDVAPNHNQSRHVARCGSLRALRFESRYGAAVRPITGSASRSQRCGDRLSSSGIQESRRFTSTLAGDGSSRVQAAADTRPFGDNALEIADGRLPR